MGTVTQASGFWKNSDLSNKINSISVIGLGYVGLPTAAMIANRGYQVIGVDVDPIVVAAITRGETPLVEPDLDKLVRSAVSSGNLKAAFKPAGRRLYNFRTNALQKRKYPRSFLYRNRSQNLGACSLNRKLNNYRIYLPSRYH